MESIFAIIDSFPKQRDLLMHRHTKNITSTTNYTNGGFIAYFFLTLSLWKASLNIFTLLQHFKPSQAWYRIPWLWLVMAIKTPWWILIKPFGCVYSHTVYLKGRCILINGDLTEYDFKKRVTHKLLGIPFFFHPSSKLTAKDWEKILN